MSTTPTVVALSGNPRPGSRTRAVAERVAARVADDLDAGEPAVIDLAEVAEEIFSPEHPRADAASATVSGARVLIVATPTYKATYTGLLKSFLDLYGNNGLAGVVAVPLQVAGNPAHLLAAEVHLRPLLVELGAEVPTRALVLTEAQLPELDAVIDAWLEANGAALRGAAARRERSLA
ncbi:NADPH-dependent FMN reductase [Georgenia sp. SYP-B2076]|uniref:NADPH-dependent FMN reductase n=1 Tax=Georgenia sp. SYP-B2076 TaxID=2495881 RepID=UPI000F8C3B49|nr:NAD(P)H-dependent oxidoreductase [Georgenia sp. SYP-B2076]